MKRFREEDGNEPPETGCDGKASRHHGRNAAKQSIKGIRLEERRADEEQKPRTLPFRTSPTSNYALLFSQTSSRSRPRPFLTSNITPVESSEDEEQQPSCQYSNPVCAQSSFQMTTRSSPPYELGESNDADADMDMIDSQISESSVPWGPVRNRVASPPQPSNVDLILDPSERASQDMALGGRIPTPRWGHFHSVNTNVDVFDTPGDIQTPSALHSTQNAGSQTPGIRASQKFQTTPLCTNSVNSQSQAETDHGLFLRRRRLPSPISEDENMISPTEITQEVEILDLRDPHQDFSYQSKTSKTLTPNERHMASPNTGKMMLSMGFRADCEKCRTRVPGHYNHIIRV